LLACLSIQVVDPTFSGDIAAYDFEARRNASLARAEQLEQVLAKIATRGDIDRPLITVAGTIDQLAPIDRHARAFRREVIRAGRAHLHRLYEVQNGGHIDRLHDSSFGFTQLQYVAPHAQRALELLEAWVERRFPAPPGQCIPRGGTIESDPDLAGRPEHCAALIEP
jgi:hypothetical protein